MDYRRGYIVIVQNRLVDSAEEAQAEYPRLSVWKIHHSDKDYIVSSAMGDYFDSRTT